MRHLHLCGHLLHKLPVPSHCVRVHSPAPARVALPTQRLAQPRVGKRRTEELRLRSPTFPHRIQRMFWKKNIY